MQVLPLLLYLKFNTNYFLLYFVSKFSYDALCCLCVCLLFACVCAVCVRLRAFCLALSVSTLHFVCPFASHAHQCCQLAFFECLKQNSRLKLNTSVTKVELTYQALKCSPIWRENSHSRNTKPRSACATG